MTLCHLVLGSDSWWKWVTVAGISSSVQFCISNVRISTGTANTLLVMEILYAENSKDHIKILGYVLFLISSNIEYIFIQLDSCSIRRVRVYK